MKQYLERKDVVAAAADVGSLLNMVAGDMLTANVGYRWKATRDHHMHTSWSSGPVSWNTSKGGGKHHGT